MMETSTKRETSKGFRLHVGFFGRRNVGKSSLLNAITRQNVSIVSEIAGTTTDPVEKPMELLPLGPVLFIDTAGIDDIGSLGEQRIEKTRQVIKRTDLGVLVAEAGEWGEFEERLLAELRAYKIPVMVALNKIDLQKPSAELIARLDTQKLPHIEIAADKKQGIDAFREQLFAVVPPEMLSSPVILRDLVPAGEMAILVMPIDKEAPKGRLILPQVQAIRDLLDGNASCIVCQDTGLESAINSLKTPPRLVVTDSQAFEKVSSVTPKHIMMTGFSVLFARLKGDLVAQVKGTLGVDALRPGDRVLVAESCTHHPIDQDIGRVKIPRWLQKYVGGELNFTTVQGHDFPADLSPYKLVIHCGACMWNRKEMLSRIMECERQGVPITNYGLVIAYSLGMFDRVLEPFPEALAVYREHKAAMAKAATAAN
jgi:[FeFe] hydrogenase H-cluster maturation GTPase HydF